MRSRVRENLPAAAVAAVGILVVSWLALSDWLWNDYDREARPAFDALVSGHLLHFLQLAPAYGGSLVLRAPFVFIPKLWGGGELAMFRAAAAPGLIATGILGVWLVARMRALERGQIARAAALLLCVANPMTLSALESGHPEELLGAVLCIAAVLAAMDNRPIWAGVLLGLAVANKEWAILAGGPVMMTLPRGRIRALLTAGVVGAVVLLPLVAAGAFATKLKGAATTASVFTPWQLWWFAGPHVHVIPIGQPWETRMEPGWLVQLARPLIVGIMLPLTGAAAWLRRHGHRRPLHEALLLLVLVLLLRCMLDPWDNTYYPLPFLLALVAWESLAAERPPVIALAGSFAAWFVFQWAVPGHGVGPDTQSLLFLTFAIPALIGISLALYAPGLSERLAFRVKRHAPVPSPA